MTHHFVLGIPNYIKIGFMPFTAGFLTVLKLSLLLYFTCSLMIDPGT